MRISRIESYLSEHVAVVKVITDDGVEGIGQTSPYQAGIAVHVLHEMVAPFFLGKNPWDVQVLQEEFLRSQYKFPSSFILRALCGVDTAIWDILGKVTDQPVCRLLGGTARAEVPMYASSMRRDIDPETEGERLAEIVSDQGFRCVKVRVGDVMARDRDAAPDRTERLIPAVRKALGDSVDINADANGGYTVSRAIRIGRILEDYGYFHFEEPCPYQQIENSAKVADALDIPVAGGEQDTSLSQFYRMIKMGAVDIVQPDIGYIGGITRARKVADLAELAGIPCTPHCANRSMLQVFTLHLAAAMTACHQYHEWSIEASSDWADQIYEPRPRVRNGVVAVPDTPGWGVSVQPSYISNARRQVSEKQ